MCVSCDQNASDTPSTRLRNFQSDAQIVSQQTQTTYTSDTSATDRVYRHRLPSSKSGQQKQKEAKNQINTSKSKHGSSCTRTTYPAINDNKDGSSVEAKRATECCKRLLFTKCSLCSKQKPVTDTSNAARNGNVCQKNPSCTHENISRDDQACVCVNTCKCDASDNDTDRKIVIGKSRQNFNAKTQNRYASDYNEQRDVEKVCDCANDRTASQNPQTMVKALCKCHSNGKVDSNGLCHFECRLKTAEHQSQAYSDSSQDSNIIKYRVQNSLQCNCDETCSCGNNQMKDTMKGRACKSYASKPNFVDDICINKTDKNCKHCRVCGAMYQNTRKCDCQSQTHPRAVAYELSFTKENISKNEISDIQIIPKAPKQHFNAAKSDACNTCDIKKNNFVNNYRQTNSSSLQVSISVNLDVYSS